MTRSRLNAMIKQAKSARDKAMETAAMLGKPTSTGIAAGAGLGAILAAAGALSRSGEDPSNVSILSNPLLLGALGATGGYLAGNAFEKAPTHRANKNLSLLALAGLAGGGGTLGSLLAKQDAFDTINDAVVNGKHVMGLKNKYLQLLKDVDLVVRDGNIGFRPRNNHPLTPKEMDEIIKTRNAYSKALRRSGDIEGAISRAGFRPSESMLGRLAERIGNHPFSPVSWTRGAFNTATRGTLLKAFTHPKARLTAGIAGAALLAGGGKALYDKLSD